MNSSRIKWIVSVVVLIIVVILILANNRSSNTGDAIKIGYFGPQTGPAAASTGEDVFNAFRLANSLKGNVSGKKVEVVYEDDACDPTKAVSAAKKLIDIDHVNILVSGVCSGSSVAVAPIAENNHVILFTPVSESPKLTAAGDYIFRTSASSLVSAHAMVVGIQQLNLHKVAILFENAEYTTGMKDAFVNEFITQPQNKIVATQGFDSKTTDLRTQLLLLSKADPEAFVFFMNSSITANIAGNQLKELKIKTPMIGNNYYSVGPVIENPNNEGYYVATYKYDENAPALKELADAYQRMFGKSAHNNFYVGLGYDGYNVLFKAIETCKGDDADCLKQALYDTKGYQGVTGTITIDKNGDTEREFTLKQIKAGKLVDVSF